MDKKEIKNKIILNGYIDLQKVIDFLKNVSLANMEVITDIYERIQTLGDMEKLQEVIEEIENGETEDVENED